MFHFSRKTELDMNMKEWQYARVSIPQVYWLNCLKRFDKNIFNNCG